MPIQLTGSLDVTGSISINGNTVSTVFNPITNLYSLINNREANVTQTLNVSAGGVFNLHISASGLHKIDASTIGATSASVNIYWYPDLFTTSGSQAATYVTLNSGSGVGVVQRSIVSTSGSYYNSQLTIGTTNSNITRQTSNIMFQVAASSAANPSMLTVMSDGTKIFGSSQNILSSTNNILLSGNQGTPIV
jgi:hypothetical protein